MNNKKIQNVKKMSIAVIAFSVVGIVVFSLLFFTSFGVVRAQWNTFDQIESFSVGNADGEIKDTLLVYIQGADEMIHEIQKMLEDKLQNNFFFHSNP